MIAVDAMGGDYAPEQIVLGALLAAQCGESVTLFGERDKIITILEKQDSSWRKYAIDLCDCDQKIDMSEDPAVAVKRKTGSSLVRAIYSVKIGKCRGVVSAGNSGAIMIGSMFVLGKDEGIERPAIIGLLPTSKNRVLCLDLGANVDCKPLYLQQFAFMANDYAKKVLNLTSPRVALLCNGHEEGKGNSLVKKTFALLKKSKLNFVGNIEPDGVFNNQADIVVSDGFSGNILLKTIEICMQEYGTDCKKIWHPGGAILLGVKGTVVVIHGNANAKEVKNAILLASKSSLKGERFYGNYKESIGCATF